MKKLLRILCAVLALAVLAMAATAGCILSTVKGRGTPTGETLIVLGTTVHGTEPSPMLRQRLDAAVEYLNAWPEAACVVTGGKGDAENLSEAQCMYNYLTAAGIDPSRITMEDRAASTIENLQNTIELLGRPDRVTILSSEFHLFRAGLMAKDLGLNANLVPAKTEPASTLLTWSAREIVAIWMYLFS